MQRNYIFYITVWILVLSIFFYIDQFLNTNLNSYLIEQIIRTPHIGIFVL